MVFAYVLKGVRHPGGGTLLSTIIGGLVGAGAVIAIGVLDVQLPPELNNEILFVIAGAVLGYMLRR